jgi:iron complex transport system substrate-binding protein
VSWWPAKSGEIPVLSRNCDAPLLGASQVACRHDANPSSEEGQFVRPPAVGQQEVLRSKGEPTLSRTIRIGGLVAVVVALVLTTGACGDDSPKKTAAPTTTAGERPARIVSLSPTATEMLFAIGAGKQVIAVDDQSNYPASAPKTALSSFKPNVEAVATYKPDLVVLSDAGDVKDGLEATGTKVLVQSAAQDLAGTYSQLFELGKATGHEKEAATVVAGMKKELTTLRASLPTSVAGLTYYHELDNTLFTATSKTFIGSVYATLGLKNIADAADKDASGYPQLSAEYILQADPDLVFLADTKCCQQSVKTVAQRPGWAQMKAVKTNAVVQLDDDIASRWGPRVVDFVRIVAERLKTVKAAA